MQAVVPAAGAETRLRPRTDDRPKPLVEGAGRPLLARGLEALASLGVEEAVGGGERGEPVRSRFGEAHRGLWLTYATQEVPLGLAHALLRGEPQ